MEFCPKCNGMMMNTTVEVEKEVKKMVREKVKKEDLEAKDSEEVQSNQEINNDDSDLVDKEDEGAEEKEASDDNDSEDDYVEITKEVIEIEKEERVVFKCMTCGYEKDPSEVDQDQYKVKEAVESSNNVIMRGDESGMRSTVREICPKCGHDRASYELLQTRSADEAPTRFFTCEKCNHKWRGYD